MKMLNICTPVQLDAGQVLSKVPRQETPKVYFLTGACVALVVETDNTDTLAVGLMGYEGVVGLAAVLDSGSDNLKYIVQTSGSAWRADSAELAQLLNQRPGMLWVISQYLWRLADHVASIAATTQFEPITTRLANWLLLSAERAQTQRLYLTQEHLAQMLGVRRVSVTLAAGELKAQGLIAYQRGKLDILDKPGLQRAARLDTTP